jgi:BirA family biotin operon repressor/biotin-[acetyl-CoA-carboxylase] ligase
MIGQGRLPLAFLMKFSRAVDVAQEIDVERLLAATTGRPGFWRPFFFREVTSTMDVARKLAEGGAQAGTVVIANAQTAGRGRLGRAWSSASSANLYFTILLRPRLQLLRRLAMVAPLAVAEGIEAATGLAPEIKWPNDVQIGGLKCSGILIDSEMRGDTPAYALVGIGINVNYDPSAEPDLAGVATSIAACTGEPVDREIVLASVLDRMAVLMDCVERGDPVQPRWKARLNTLGRTVNVRGGDKVETGVVEDVTDEGSLVLRRADGSSVVVAAGEVTLRV